MTLPSGRIVFLRLFNTGDDSTVAQWQNGFKGATIDGHIFLDFGMSGFSDSTGSKQATLTMETAWKNSVELAMRGALGAEVACLVELKAYVPVVGVPSSFTTIVSFYGEVVGGEERTGTLRYQIGSALQTLGVGLGRLVYTNENVGKLAEPL